MHNSFPSRDIELPSYRGKATDADRDISNRAGMSVLVEQDRHHSGGQLRRVRRGLGGRLTQKKKRHHTGLEQRTTRDDPEERTEDEGEICLWIERRVC